MELAVQSAVADIFKSPDKLLPRRDSSPALSRLRVPSQSPAINSPLPLRSLQHLSTSPQNPAKPIRGPRKGLLPQLRPPDPPRVPSSIRSGPSLPSSQSLPVIIFSTTSSYPHSNLAFGCLSGEIHPHPTPPPPERTRSSPWCFPLAVSTLSRRGRIP